jgi:AmmeMemoRadiSam system protein B
MKTRNAVVEGRFYPASREKVFDQIREIEQEGRYPVMELDAERIYGGILPHAGHVYSGYQTIPFFQLIRRAGRLPGTFVILHPNHTGSGLPLAIDDAEVWKNSIGDVPLDVALADAMDLPFSRLSHAHEHSAEVIIPYMQYYLEDHHFSIVPVCMMDQTYESARHVAERIHRAASKLHREPMVLASSDFSHFLPASEGEKKDQLVLDEIMRRNASGVAEAVRRNHITVCGYGPIMALMEYAGMDDPGYRIELLARGHSGEVIPSREVVDYISMILYR